MLARILSGPPAPAEKSKSGFRGATPVPAASIGSYRQAVCPTCGHLCEKEPEKPKATEQPAERNSELIKRTGPRRVR